MIEGTGPKIDKTLPSIKINNFTKKFGRFLATENINFEVGHGVIHGFIGPNGAGKTTTIKSIIGAYIPTKGEILINGKKSGSERANRLIGYIPERASFPRHLNSLQYLVAMGELSGIKPKEARKRAKEILSALGLSAHARRKPSRFSSGMQKKILLAQSLLTDPSIFILDEPAANLDPTARKDLFDQLIMLRKQGKTIFISSHILAELERIVDEVTFIYNGAIIYSGKTSKLIEGKSDVFIKSQNNVDLNIFLVKHNYQISGDVKTEIIINDLERHEVDKLLADLVHSKIPIISFRSNDLQVIYDKLLLQSQNSELGHQKINNKKINKDGKVINSKKGDN